MYAIDKSFEFDKLIGLTVEQITFSMNNVTIFLNTDDDYIQIMSSFELETPTKLYHCKDAYHMQNDHGLLGLIGKKIKELYVDYDDNNTEIVMSDGYRLSIFSDNDYESYWIMAEGKEMLV